MVSSKKKIIKKTQDKQKKKQSSSSSSSGSSTLPKAQTAQEFKNQLQKIEDELASFGVSSDTKFSLGSSSSMNDNDEDNEDELQVVKPGQKSGREAGDAYHKGVRGGGVRKTHRKVTGKVNRRKQAKVSRALDYQDRRGEQVVKKLVKRVHQFA